ncbi:hypothetical protein B0I18_10293 [Taibaiella chishuiensis]|uniref:Uncharacterized protein n=1 Tax=Taibaiella chishuiensis TaxID=1434707 RepID=A0A2P8D7C0_9BACT|nr:hypothetical protein B0I18_10293 [Taibaiella chishuiensis]
MQMIIRKIPMLKTSMRRQDKEHSSPAAHEQKHCFWATFRSHVYSYNFY